jgi:hypothetical protein
MNHYNYQNELKNIWEKSVALHKSGNLNKSEWLSDDEISFLESIGSSLQEIYDFAEDFNKSNEPDFITVALIQDVRKSYFIEVQNSQRSKTVITPDQLPAKSDEVLGIRWLPRICIKAVAKIRGELHNDIMFLCGGDRIFFKENNIHPAEFLRQAWKYENDKEALYHWVKNRATLCKCSA